MWHQTFCLPDWLTDCFCLCLLCYRPSRWLPAFWLSYRLYQFIAIRFIYQSVCAYLNLWLNELMILCFGLIYSCLPVHFLSICLLMPFNPFPPSSDIHLVLFACVSILTRNHLCCLVSPHFITCLTDLSLTKDFCLTLDLYKRSSEKNETFANSLGSAACLL